mgnify:CR=1 FL=1
MNGHKAGKQIALIKTGCTIDQIKPRHGDFEDWFAEGLGLDNFLQVDVFRHQPLPQPENLAAVVVTGSPAMVSARLDWSERTAKWLQKAVTTGLPVLGVCYGHQLLAHALGGIAGPNPAGRQIGTVKSQLIDIKSKDPLLGYLPVTFAAQTSHSEVVLEVPAGAQSLATSPLDENFAIRFAENAWGVQFHPEFSAEITRGYLDYHAATVTEAGRDPEQLKAEVMENDVGDRILRRFATIAGLI